MMILLLTARVAGVADLGGDVPMPGSAAVALYYLGIRLGEFEDPICPAEDPEPCPWLPGEVTVQFDLPIEYGPPGPYSVRYSATDGAQGPMFCVELKFTL